MSDVYESVHTLTPESIMRIKIIKYEASVNLEVNFKVKV